MPPKKKSYAERFYNLSNDDMLELVRRFQNGDDAAGMKMLEVFENFLSNFIKLLFHGTYDRSNYEMRRFISLYVPSNNLRWKLMRNKLSATDIKEVNEVVRGIVGMTQRFCTIEDVEQSVRMSFLNVIKIYVPRASAQGGSVPIANYVSNYSLYIFKKATDTFLIDQVGRRTFPLIQESDTEDNEDNVSLPGFVAPAGPGLEAYLDRDEFDENWVAGDTAKGVWATLTPAERQLLKWRYIDGEKTSEIANRTLEHQNTLREKILRIKVKIAEYLEVERLDLERA